MIGLRDLSKVLKDKHWFKQSEIDSLQWQVGKLEEHIIKLNRYTETLIDERDNAIRELKSIMDDIKIAEVLKDRSLFDYRDKLKSEVYSLKMEKEMLLKSIEPIRKVVYDKDYEAARYNFRRCW